MKAKKPKAALDAFGAFIVRYPDHPYAANALYWRGESYYSLSDFSNAIAQFDALAIRYPASSKLPDARPERTSGSQPPSPERARARPSSTICSGPIRRPGASAVRGT